MSDRKEGGLRRDIGFWGSSFLSFNGMVGAGIFALPAALALQFGDFSPWLFPLFGILIVIVALPFARLASYFPSSGGPVAYTASFGPFASFQMGWLYYVARITALAANANIFAAYMASLWPPFASGTFRVLAIIALFGTLTLVNVVGVKRAIRTLDALTLLKAAPLILFALFGLAVTAGSIPFPSAFPPVTEVEAAALLVFYTFIGFENSVVPAGETANPRRTIPRALIFTLGGTALLYFLVQLSYVSVMDGKDGGEAPLVAFATILVGPIGGLVLIGAALCSLAGNLTGSLTSTPRVTLALSEQGSLPHWFGKVSERFGTPANSILFMGLLGAILAVTGSFVWLAVASTLARLFVYTGCTAALPSVSKREDGDRFAPFWMVSMAAALAVCIWAALQSAWPAWRLLFILVGVGTLLYGGARLLAVRPR